MVTAIAQHHITAFRQANPCLAARIKLAMPDSLYLNLWFPSFTEAEMMPRLACVLGQFPFSKSKPGIGYVGVHSVSWSEPLVFQQSFDYRADTVHAIALASEFLHSDSGYIFEAAWDLWSPKENSDEWTEQPHPVKFLAHGKDFEDGVAEESGHIQVDLGLDAPFLFEEFALTPAIENRVKQNIQKLVGFTAALEKNCGVTGRLLWSESEENLAQKLIARLQRVN
jgi:hypothetical protein